LKILPKKVENLKKIRKKEKEKVEKMRMIENLKKK